MSKSNKRPLEEPKLDAKERKIANRKNRRKLQQKIQNIRKEAG